MTTRTIPNHKDNKENAPYEFEGGHNRVNSNSYSDIHKHKRSTSRSKSKATNLDLNHLNTESATILYQEHPNASTLGFNDLMTYQLHLNTMRDYSPATANSMGRTSVKPNNT